LIHFKAFGSALKTTQESKQHLVLLHGFGFCGEIFTPLIQRYQEQYIITAIDLPGHGKSATLDNFDEWIQAIIPIVPNNAIILGWSLGGLVALALTQHTSYQKIILCGSSPKFVKGDNWEFGITQSNFQSFTNTLATNITKGLTRFISLQGLDKPHTKILKSIIQNNPPTPAGLTIALNVLQTIDMRKIIDNIDNIEVFLGNKDTIVPWQIINWYQAHNITTHVLEGGHLPFLQKNFKIE
jgi:pimeloyl-[acyl-carrier protein] methyl ester esterase